MSRPQWRQRKSGSKSAGRREVCFSIRFGAEIAAITHGHPLGYLPAAILTHIISVGVYGDGKKTLLDAVDEAWETVREMFAEKVSSANLNTMESLLTKAKTYANAVGSDEEHIRAIGEGWIRWILCDKGDKVRRPDGHQ